MCGQSFKQISSKSRKHSLQRFRKCFTMICVSILSVTFFYRVENKGAVNITKYQSTLSYSNNRSCTHRNISPLALGLRRKYGFFSAGLPLREAPLSGVNETLVLGIATSYGAYILNYFLVSLAKLAMREKL